MGYYSQPEGVAIIQSDTFVGDDAANRAIPHNLGKVPKLVILYRSNTTPGYPHAILNLGTQWFILDGATVIGVTAADATNFYVSSTVNIGGSTQRWVALA